eukprot:8984284-Pyramimonas_sp.AAC.1
MESGGEDSRAPRWGRSRWGRRIAPQRRCIADAAQCGARFASRRRRRCIAGVDDAWPVHRRCIADTSSMYRRCGAIPRPHLLRPHPGGL